VRQGCIFEVILMLALVAVPATIAARNGDRQEINRRTLDVRAQVDLRILAMFLYMMLASGSSRNDGSANATCSVRLTPHPIGAF